MLTFTVCHKMFQLVVTTGHPMVHEKKSGLCENLMNLPVILNRHGNWTK